LAVCACHLLLLSYRSHSFPSCKKNLSFSVVLSANATPLTEGLARFLL